MVTVTFGVCFVFFSCFSSSNKESDDKIFMAEASDFRMDTQWMIPKKFVGFNLIYPRYIWEIIHKQWRVLIGYNYIYNPLHMILITYSCISSLYPCDLIFTKMSLRTWSRLDLLPLKFRARLRVCLEAARGDTSSAPWDFFAKSLGISQETQWFFHRWNGQELSCGTFFGIILVF